MTSHCHSFPATKLLIPLNNCLDYQERKKFSFIHSIPYQSDRKFLFCNRNWFASHFSLNKKELWDSIEACGAAMAIKPYQLISISLKMKKTFSFNPLWDIFHLNVLATFFLFVLLCFQFMTNINELWRAFMCLEWMKCNSNTFCVKVLVLFGWFLQNFWIMINVGCSNLNILN